MNMLSNQRIAPCVVLKTARDGYKIPALSKSDFDAARSALKLTGIPNALFAIIDEAARNALDEVAGSI